MLNCDLPNWPISRPRARPGRRFSFSRPLDTVSLGICLFGRSFIIHLVFACRPIRANSSRARLSTHTQRASRHAGSFITRASTDLRSHVGQLVSKPRRMLRWLTHKWLDSTGFIWTTGSDGASTQVSRKLASDGQHRHIEPKLRFLALAAEAACEGTVAKIEVLRPCGGHISVN